MTTKFEAGKTYTVKRTCGNYTYVEELKVEEIMSTGSISGTWTNYMVDNKTGIRYNGTSHGAYTRVRKAPGKDYQMTSDLYVRFYAI